jgi:3-phenylpropionate/cinnamic acid dioxygenase small subunit
VPAAEPSPFEAIAQLLARYAELIDDGDFAGLGGLLAAATITMEDGTVVATGADEVRRLYESTTRRHADGTPKTQHVITNLIVEPLDDDGARYEARSRFTVLQATGDVPLQPIVAGRYRDVAERTPDGGYRFVERCMIVQLVGDVSHHLLIDL